MLITWKPFSQPLFNVAVTFEEIGINQTKIVFKQIFETAAACDKIKAFASDKNEEVFDRLERALAEMV